MSAVEAPVRPKAKPKSQAQAQPSVATQPEFKRWAPYRGSVAYKLIVFLRENPGRALGRLEIYKQFHLRNRSSVNECLEPAVKNGALIREKNEVGQVQWRLGPSDKVVLLPLAEGTESEKPRAQVAGSPHDPFGTTRAVRVFDIPVQRGTATTPDLADAEAARQWLSQFNVGDTAEFLLIHMDAIRRVVNTHGRRFGKFRFVRSGAAHMKLERCA